MTNPGIQKTHSSQEVLEKLQIEINETYRGVLELVDEAGDSDNLEQALALKDEVNKLTTELDETYRGVIELATSLENSEQKVDMMFQGAELGLWEWQTESGEFSVNLELRTIVGLAEQHIVESVENYDQLIHQDDLPNVRRARTLFLNGKRNIFHVEHRLMSDTNGWVWVLCNGRAISHSDAGKPLNVRGSMLNIDARKRMEQKQKNLNLHLEQQITERTLEIERTNNKLLEEIRGHQETVRALMQAREAADTANKAKSSFIANMSHELRTPLNAILGYAQLMANDKTLNTVQSEQINSVNRAGNHLLDLLNDVLDMAKIEAGHISTNLKAFNLDQLLNDIKSIFLMRAEQKGLTLSINRHKNVPKYIISDEQKIRQILINLLGNALKFTEQGGVELKISSVEINHQYLQLSFEVEDTGVGIKENNLEQIFHVFEQAEAGLERSDGTGLGLAISKEFALLLGGDITVNSKVKVGSCFNFTCQIELTKSQSADSVEPGYRITGIEKGQKDVRVLVADDDVASRDIVVKLLDSVGMHTQQTESAKQTMSQYKKWQPNILIINLDMLVINDVDIIKNIRGLANNEQIIIIGISASATEDGIQDALAQGVDAVLYKPLSFKYLFQAIEQHTDILFTTEKIIEDRLNEFDSSLASMGKLVKNLPEDLQHALSKAVLLGATQELRILTEELKTHNKELADLFNKYINDYNLEPLMKILE